MKQGRQPRPKRTDTEPGATEPADTVATPPLFEITTSRQFASWLADSGISLALSTYQTGRVFLIGSVAATGKLWVFNRSFERPMGLAAAQGRLVVATQTQIIDLVDANEGGPMQDGVDACFVPQVAYFTGDLDVHDLAVLGDGSIVFANTLFSCVATVSLTHSFRPLWRPRFVDRYAAEDRCHLNGLAVEGERVRYVTAIAPTNVADGWRDHRRDGGVVLDVDTGDTIASGLSMPHSPRLHRGKLWLLNSGAGEIGFADMATGRFEPVAFIPGYVRGLAFHDKYAIVGLSEARENKTFSGLPLEDRLAREKVGARCGLAVVDLDNGDVVHWLRFSGVVRELYDVAVLRGLRKPTMIGFKSDEIRRVISIEQG